MLNNYQKAFKGSLIFGGVQIFQVLISLIRGKITAVFVGPEGMGLSGIFTSSLAPVITLVGLGCNLSAVRYISSIDKQNEDYYTHIQLVQRIFLILSVVGGILTWCLSYFLSILSFQSTKYFVAFLSLSVYVFCSVYSGGITSILQGMQEYKKIAIGNILPSLLGLFFAIPLYIKFNIGAVVPVIILVPFFSVIYGRYVLHKFYTDVNVVPINRSMLLKLLCDLVSLGVFAVIASLLGNITIYMINTFITHYGDLKDLGLFQAGMSITNQYVGLIFTAMNADYFPRLTETVSKKKNLNEVVCAQGEITLLLAFPLLALMICTAPLLVRILLSGEFLLIISFIKLLAFGMLFKAASFCLGAISFAHGDKLVFLFLEGIFGNIVNLVFSCLGYYWDGLKGLSYAFILQYIIYFVIISFISYKRYSCVLNKNFFYLFFSAVLGLGVLVLISMVDGWIPIIVCSAITLVVCVFSLYLLNKKIGFLSILKANI